MFRHPDLATVRLLEDVPTFGRKGAFVTVSVGMMRNEWYPRRLADYVPYTQKKELKANDVSTERDFDFMAERPEEDSLEEAAIRDAAAQELEARRQQLLEVERVSPERSIELLDRLLPPRLDFSKEVIESASKDEVTSSTSAGSQALFGSVTVADVAAKIRQNLSENLEASMISIAEEDVKFLGVKESDRVKHVGEYQVEVRVRGSDVVVKRAVRVQPRKTS
ncbi:hypothetical protein MBLNU457_6024t1 [Dothideomycetes sp. NU457]